MHLQSSLRLSELLRRVGNEFSAIHAESVDEVLDLISLDRSFEPIYAVWIEVVGPDKDFSLPSGDRKRPNAGHHIANCLTTAELVNDSLMLGSKSAIPVYFGEIERKLAVGL